MSLGQVRDMIIRVASTVFLPPTTSVKVKESNPLGQYSEHSVADSHNGHTADAAPLTRPGFTRRGFPISSSKRTKLHSTCWRPIQIRCSFGPSSHPAPSTSRGLKFNTNYHVLYVSSQQPGRRPAHQQPVHDKTMGNEQCLRFILWINSKKCEFESESI